MSPDVCAYCHHPISEHILAVEQCRHQVAEDTYCVCPGYEVQG